MRHMVTKTLVMAGLLLGVFGCAKPVPPASIFVADLPDLQSVGLKSAWQRLVHLSPGNHVINAWRVGSSLYVTTSEAHIVRIDAKSGVQFWDVGLGSENDVIYKPVEMKQDAGVAVLVVTRGKAFILDGQSGVTRQDSRLGLSVSTNPVVLGATLGVGGPDAFYGIYLDKLQGTRWKVAAPGDLFTASPATNESDVLLASRHGKLWRVSAETGVADWRDRKTNGDVVAPLLADTRALYVACLDQRVYSFDVSTGSELWESQLEGGLDQPMTAADATLLIPSTGRGLFAVARDTGIRKWFTPGIKAVATTAAHSAWVTDDEGNLKSLSLETGEVLASAPIADLAITVQSASADNQVIVVNRGGMVGAYSPK